MRVVYLRTGLVLGHEGGLLPKLTLLTKLGAGGRLGSGRQYYPWISATDEIDGILHLLTSDVSGPVNMSGPQPVTNAEFTRELGRQLHRPTPWAVPTLPCSSRSATSRRRSWPARTRSRGYSPTPASSSATPHSRKRCAARSAELGITGMLSTLTRRIDLLDPTLTAGTGGSITQLIGEVLASAAVTAGVVHLSRQRDATSCWTTACSPANLPGTCWRQRDTLQQLAQADEQTIGRLGAPRGPSSPSERVASSA